MAKQTKEKTGAGLTLGLQILAACDLGLSLAMLVVAVSAGAPYSVPPSLDPDIVGTGYALLIGQMLLRCMTLPVMSRWTWRLVFNADKQARLPVSPRWAWLGWFVPGAGFVLPLKAVLALNGGAGGIMGGLEPWRRILIMAWWPLRLLTCLSGGIVLIYAVAFLTVIIHILAKTGALDGTQWTVNFLFWLAVTAMAARLLECAVVTLTFRRQPRSGEIVASTVF